MLEALWLWQEVPDVTEVEVNADGRWRPAGSDMAWLTTLGGTPPLTKAQLTKPSLPIKPDPEQAGDGECHFSKVRLFCLFCLRPPEQINTRSGVVDISHLLSCVSLQCAACMGRSWQAVQLNAYQAVQCMSDW